MMRIAGRFYKCGRSAQPLTTSVVERYHA